MVIHLIREDVPAEKILSIHMSFRLSKQNVAFCNIKVQ